MGSRVHCCTAHALRAACALFALLLAGCATARRAPITWTADNGNGTYSNPLFNEEFSDPDVIRVGTDYYLTGTTMHTMPGLPVLHSKDLVNWELASYAFDRIDLSPAFRLEGGKEIYGQGIWAPSIRFARDTFYIFSNINGYGTQVYRSASPRGPWQHNRLSTTLYDLGVLFDDDGRIWAVHLADDGIDVDELNRGITDIVPGTHKVIIDRRRMGEGLHFYKIDGTYYLISAIPGAHTPMVVARSRTMDGPWAVDTMVAGEALGVHTGNSLARPWGTDSANATFTVVKNDPNSGNGLTLHQGGMVSTPNGQWWSIIMQDHRSLGRLSDLVPVTWQDGWPYIGLPGNLRRAPRIWVKPATGVQEQPHPLFTRDDDFDRGNLNPLWQWNHVPDDTKWSLSERPGVLRLHSLAASDFWWARNTLTQRAVGPVSTVTVKLEAAGMQPGDVAGLALLNQPYAWIGFVRGPDGLTIREYDQLAGRVADAAAGAQQVWLRADCDYEKERATLQYSRDGRNFRILGDTFTLAFQLKTFQGIRYSLFNYNTGGAPGGYADFDDFTVYEPRPRGLSRPIPYGRTIRLASLADGSVLAARGDRLEALAGGAGAGAGSGFRIVDMDTGRVALQAPDGRFVSVASETGEVMLRAGKPGLAGTFQWEDLSGDIAFMSLSNHRYLLARPGVPVVGNHAGPRPDHRDGSAFLWVELK